MGIAVISQPGLPVIPPTRNDNPRALGPKSTRVTRPIINGVRWAGELELVIANRAVELCECLRASLARAAHKRGP